MKATFVNVYYGLVIVVFITVIAEFFFAGMGIFHASSFKVHMTTGILLWGASALLLLLALVGKAGKRAVGLATVLFVLMLVQPLLLQFHQPFLKAFHPVNGAVILLITLAMMVPKFKRPTG